MKAPVRIQYLHLLRGGAALSVCIFHFAMFEVNGVSVLPDDFWLKGILSKGYLGVHVFFILSGFLVSYSAYKGSYTYSKWFSFLKRRLLRIEPPYMVSVFLMFFGYLLLHIWKGWSFPWTADDLFYNLTYLVPFVKDAQWLNVTYWTLAIEFQFYILIMLTLPLLFNIRKWVRIAVFTVLALSSVFISFEGLLSNHISLFLVGILMAQSFLGLWRNWEYLVMQIALIGLLCFQYYLIDPWVIAVGVLVLISFPIFKHMSPVNGFLGNISYSLYITHCLFLTFCFGLVLQYWKGWHNHFLIQLLVLVAGIISSIAFATIFYRLVEKPAQDLSRKVKQ